MVVDVDAVNVATFCCCHVDGELTTLTRLLVVVGATKAQADELKAKKKKSSTRDRTRSIIIRIFALIKRIVSDNVGVVSRKTVRSPNYLLVLTVDRVKLLPLNGDRWRVRAWSVLRGHHGGVMKDRVTFVYYIEHVYIRAHNMMILAAQTRSQIEKYPPLGREKGGIKIFF